MEMPEGWKRQYNYYKSLVNSEIISKPCEQQIGLELMKEMAEALEFIEINGTAEVGMRAALLLHKFKEWK